MPLGQRVLRVNIEMPNGTVTLDESLDIRVQIHKDALAIQNRALITAFNLSQSLRESLLSQFTAWNKRNLESGQPGYKASYINATIEAGYHTSTQDTTTTVFKGQVVVCTPASGPPNIGIRIELNSRQLSQIQFITSPAPTQTTFKAYVEWAAQQMGVTAVCETSYNDQVITNPSAQTMVVGALLLDIQNVYRPNVAAFIDNDQLIVKDVNKVISTAQIVQVSEFIDTPLWTEWGVEFIILYDPKIQLAGAATLKSLMNPSLNQTFVLTSLDYDLCSRDTPFYVHASGSPSA